MSNISIHHIRNKDKTMISSDKSLYHSVISIRNNESLIESQIIGDKFSFANSNQKEISLTANNIIFNNNNYIINSPMEYEKQGKDLKKEHKKPKLKVKENKIFNFDDNNSNSFKSEFENSQKNLRNREEIENFTSLEENDNEKQGGCCRGRCSIY